VWIKKTKTKQKTKNNNNNNKQTNKKHIHKIQNCSKVIPITEETDGLPCELMADL
jgi:hypothetical protein